MPHAVQRRHCTAGFRDALWADAPTFCSAVHPLRACRADQKEGTRRETERERVLACRPWSTTSPTSSSTPSTTSPTASTSSPRASAAPTPRWRRAPTGSRTTSRRTASGPATTSASTATTRSSGSRPCGPCSRSARRGSTSTTATSRRSSRTSSRTPTSRPSCTSASSRRACAACSSTSRSSQHTIVIDDGSGEDLTGLDSVDFEDAMAERLTRPRLRAALRRRPLHPLHGRHHRHAEGRRVAPRGRVLRARRRHRHPSRTTRVEQPASAGRDARSTRPVRSTMMPIAPLMHGATQWGGDGRLVPRQQGRAHGQVRRRPRCGELVERGEGQPDHDHRRRDGAADDRRAREPTPTRTTSRRSSRSAAPRRCSRRR